MSNRHVSSFIFTSFICFSTCSDGNDAEQADKKLRRKKAVKSKRRHTTVSIEHFNAIYIFTVNVKDHNFFG